MPEIDKNITILKSDSWRMFDEISPKYDFLNQLLSFGLHHHWRRRLIEFLPQKEEITLLDVATGTADVVLTLCQHNSHIISAAGIDLADKMLSIGRKKIMQNGLHTRVKLQHGDANKIPFNGNSFDVTTIAFGIRNVEDPTKALSEMARVLRPTGKALILEFSLPKNPVLRSLHLFYLRNIVPLVGGAISGNVQAYRYLNQTIEFFPYGEKFCQIMRQAGFKNAQAHELLLGVATIYVGEK